jgi:hypothetical protein
MEKRVEFFPNLNTQISKDVINQEDIDRNLEENCGVFGIIGKKNASRAAFFALYALNHR